MQETAQANADVLVHRGDVDNATLRTLFRTRKPNWTEQETLMLVALVDKHCILRCRLMDYNTNQQKTEVWCTITALINQHNSTVQRTVEEVKRRWQNVYSIAKREASEYHLAVKNTAAHQPPPQLHQFLCPISVRLVEIFGGIDDFAAQHNALLSAQPGDRSSNSYDLSSDPSNDSVPPVRKVPSGPLPTAERPIKREANTHELEAWYIGEVPRYGATFANIASPTEREDLGPPTKQLCLPTPADAGTQTDDVNEEERLRLETLGLERDLLKLQVERQMVRLQRDRMRLQKEEAARDLRLERHRLENKKLAHDASNGW